MYKFSIASSLKEEHCGIANLELDDKLLGKPLADMNGCEVEEVRNQLIDSLCRAVLYTADIPAAEYDRWVRFFLNAHLIQAENVLKFRML